jgi:hypothetical protein
VTTTAPQRVLAADLLAPVTATMHAMFGIHQPPSLAPGLLVLDDAGWFPATLLADGSRVADLLDCAQDRWQAPPHTAGSLVWKSYSYWLSLPAVLGWASARRVPLLRPADVLVRLDHPSAPVTVGLRPTLEFAVLTSDPLAGFRLPRVRVTRDETELLEALRESLFDAHLEPVLDAVANSTRLGVRTLRGTVSSGIANGVLRAGAVVPSVTGADAAVLLRSLGLEDLVDLVPGPAGEPTVRRKTCCLAFTLPTPKVCAGCCLRT